MIVDPHTRGNALTRRQALAGSAALAVLATAEPSLAAYVDDGDPAAALKHIAQGRPITPGRVKLILPELAENGNVVTLAVAVDSPMTASDHVKTIHIVAEKNPLANLARFHLNPRAGRADVQTNVRLATTQSVNAVAEMSDGTLWLGTSTVLVTLSACLDGG